MSRLPRHPALGIAILVACLAAAAYAYVVNGTNGKFEVTVTKAADKNQKDRISITYTPDTTKVRCGTIYLAQTCRDVDQTGTNVIKPQSYLGGTFVHLGDDMTEGGTYIDHVVCEKDPYYNGEDTGKDKKSAGSSDGHTATPTTMSDAPYIRDSSYPAGVTSITSTFTVCAVCKDDGRILDCIQWTWTRAQGDSGKGTVTGPTAAGGDTTAFKAALAKYNTNHKNGTVCPEAVAETHPGGKNVQPGNNKKLPYDPPVSGQPTNVRWDVVNTGPSDVTAVTWAVWLDGLYLTGGMLPVIPWFDFATVDFAVPPLGAGPHTLTLVVDSDGLIPEYDETDNNADDEFVVSGPGGVGPQPSVAFGITALRPNPTRGRLAATVALRGDGPAVIELMDMNGRRVRELARLEGEAGIHTVHLETGRDIAPGLYMLRLRQGERSTVRKVTLTR